MELKAVAKKKQKSFSDIYLSVFQENNKHCEISIDEKHIVIEKPWGGDDLRLKIDIDDQEFIKDINNIFFNRRFDAIFHIDTNTIEFIFSFLNPRNDNDKSFMNRDFVFHFNGNEYKSYFSVPSSRLYKLASASERVPSDGGIRSITQLAPFKDFQKLDTLPKSLQNFFEGREPRSFFIEPNEDISTIDIVEIARHLNFITSYYDRKSPVINIHDDEILEEEKYKPKRYLEDEFPKAFLVHQIDDIILKLMEVARMSSPRFAFLYYYQVFEYAGYYYMDEKAKVSIRKFLKDPAIINCAEEKVTELFSVLSDVNHNDDVKMTRVIEEHCDPRSIWSDVSHDLEFFSTETTFDGGFQLKPLISRDTTCDSWNSMWTPKLYNYLTKIRNSLVHARERRENKVILPTKQNNTKLERLIPIISRLAQQVALKS